MVSFFTDCFTCCFILSAEGTKDDIPEELKAFLEYVTGKAPESDYTRKIDNLVNHARKHVEWRKEYMTLLERDERMREEGRKEEHTNTEREAARADAAERRVDELAAENKMLKEKLSEYNS